MFYPLFIDLQGRSVLVVGGGPVAERKVASLLEAGAVVTVVAPEATPHLQHLHSNGAITLKQRAFLDQDMKGFLLAVSATDDEIAQKRIAAAAGAEKVLINTVDIPALCDFIVPAVIRRGDVILAISTSGKSPALAAALRARLSKVITEDVARSARILGSVRKEVRERFPAEDKRKDIFEKIVGSGIVDWIGEYADDAALERVRQIIEENS